MRRYLILLIGVVVTLVACQRVPITGRKQMKMVPKSTLNSMSFTSYKQFLSEHKLSTDQANTNLVKTVGKNIQKAVENYFTKTGKTKLLAGYAWEFNLVEDPQVNAWCMPGGKVVVYTGLLPIAKNADGLAVVMGHEISHAIANHGNERMSQGLAAQVGITALDVALSQKPEATRNAFLQAVGIGAQVGILLPFSRMHESEADEMGLYFMAMAGYNPHEAVPFWERMAAKSGGGAPPEFLSTHPSDATRIKKLKEKIPVAEAMARKYPIKK
ncbi:MAG: M48 family metallopeptidase [Bacteroidia bacterium]|nr:M48 family metallopeptidase [Bacteroidia bacterium]